MQVELSGKKDLTEEMYDGAEDPTNEVPHDQMSNSGLYYQQYGDEPMREPIPEQLDSPGFFHKNYNQSHYSANQYQQH